LRDVRREVAEGRARIARQRIEDALLHAVTMNDALVGSLAVLADELVWEIGFVWAVAGGEMQCVDLAARSVWPFVQLIDASRVIPLHAHDDLAARACSEKRIEHTRDLSALDSRRMQLA